MSVFLKKVEIFGFKSFADRTKIEFNSPITAIIGPNGSGKSNIVDAIRWVLGESSYKVLRGNTFEDIIFAGSQYRPSLSVAEVSLLFDNTKRILQIPFDEVEITKRYYKSGEGKVFINKQEARVKDVVSLFLGTGFGKEGYSIVGQGEVDKLVVGTPQDKRNYIDELLGVSKVKFKKKEAEKRLQDININLSNIIIRFESVEREYSRLKIEIEKLKQFKELSKELENLEKIYSVFKSKTYKTELKKLIEKKEDLSKKISEINEKITNISDKIISLDTLLQTENLTLSNLREQLNSLEKIIKSKEIEKKSIESKTEMSRKTIEIYSSSITKEIQRKEELEKEKNILQNQIEKLQTELSQTQSTITEIQEQLKQLEKQKSFLESEKFSKISSIETIRETIRKIESTTKEINWLSQRLNEITSLKNEVISSLQETRVLIENSEKEKNSLVEEIKALKVDKETIILKMNETINSIKSLEDKISEIQTVINNLSKQSEKLFQEFSKNISSSALKIGEFINKVDISTQKIINYCENVLNESSIEDIKQKILEIKEISKNINEDIKNLPFLANATEFISKKIEIDNNILSMRNSLEEINENLISKKEILSTLKEQQKEIEVILSSKENEIFKYEKYIDSLVREAKNKTQKIEELEKEISNINNSITNLKSNLIKHLEDYHKDADVKSLINNLTEEFEQHANSIKIMLEKKLDITSLSEIEEKLKEIEVEISQTRNELIQLETKNTITQSNIKSSKERISKISEEVKKIEEFINLKQKEIEVEKENIGKYSNEHTLINEELEKLSKERDELLKQIAEKSLNSKELNQKYRETINEKDLKTKELSNLEKEMFSIEEKIILTRNEIENLNKNLIEKYNIDLDNVEKEITLLDIDIPQEEIIKRISQLKGEIKKIGFVNENAEEEFRAVEEEYFSLKSNLDDILQSKQKLEEMIDSINREIEKIVKESLASINEVITEVFKEIFGGGGVRIEIEQNDVIEGGIELHVSIPGKKVKNLLLLSGGEKALVGIIFIFSALMINNTPVVILDEVDAPLDDENTERFKKLILTFQDRTQFIIISHNKSTIKICQDIYGVTMEEKGVSKVVSYKLQEVEI